MVICVLNLKTSNCVYMHNTRTAKNKHLARMRLEHNRVDNIVRRDVRDAQQALGYQDNLSVEMELQERKNV